jgi:parallel beta-helix repeat protein
MNKKIIAMSIFVIFVITVIEGSSDVPKLTNCLTAPPEDFDHFFKGNNSIDDIIGTDFDEPQWDYTGHVADVVDTKNPPTDKVDVCDNVVIKWTRKKDPQLREPWVTYHIYKMEEEIDGWSFWFDKRSSSKYPPWGNIKPYEGLPPFPGDENSSHYVDSGNINGPWDGSTEHPYQFIQDGINAADPGHKIIVSYGSYNENLMIEKHDIVIISRTFDSPIIDGGSSGSVVTITGDWVTMHGFTIQNSGNMEEDAGVDLISDNTTIFGNNIQGNQNGIYLHQSANNNEIYDNDIKSNVWGVFIWEESNNNRIYTNNLISNTGFNAKDTSQNIWYSDIINGNYWDDYSGLDSNGDGIGDTPHIILGSDNEDIYPLMNPVINSVPGAPDINGPTSGKPNENYTYSFISVDSDSHDLIYEINWGDGFEEKSSLFSPSGEQISFNHSWEGQESYIVKARAMDYYGDISDWATLEVTIQKSKLFSTQLLFQRFFQRFPLFEKILNQII